MFTVSLLMALSAVEIHNKGPAFSCSFPQSRVEAIICADAELSLLDLELAVTFRKARLNADGLGVYHLYADRKKWRQRRDQCTAEENTKSCVKQSYERRIAELKARYGMAKPSATVSYDCNTLTQRKALVSFFDTDPKMLIAKYGDKNSAMFDQSSDNDFYVSRNGSSIQIQEKEIILKDADKRYVCNAS